MMGANYRKPNQDMKIDMMPKWMDTIMIICKWFIYTMPFIITSVMFFMKSEMTLYKYKSTSILDSYSFL